MIIYGSSGIGEPEYAGAIYSPDLASLEPVELALEYDSTPAWGEGLGLKLPAWLGLVAVAYLVASRVGGRI